MSNLSSDDVKHIAKLARLHISDEEAQKYSKELTSILDFVDTLQEVDTTNVQPLSQATDIHNSLREDEVITQEVSGAEMLQTSPLPIIDHQIQTPSAL